jgi:hypothetical protein
MGLRDDENQKLHIKTNDKIPIITGEGENQKTTLFIGLEESLKEFNEENINKVVSNIFALSDMEPEYDEDGNKKELSNKEYINIWRSQQELLKKDYGFSVEDGHVMFMETNASFHRKNKKLMDVLERYIKWTLERLEKKKILQENYEIEVKKYNEELEIYNKEIADKIVKENLELEDEKRRKGRKSKREENEKFKKPKPVLKRILNEKKPKEFKILENKGGINENAIHLDLPFEMNLDNILQIISNNRKKNIIKF